MNARIKFALSMSVVLLFSCTRDKPKPHSEVLGPPSLDKNADELQQTEFTAYLNHEITPGRNLIWCATMQLAWNELCGLHGGEVHLEGGDPRIVVELNRKVVTRADLDDSSFIAVAGFLPDILDTVNQTLDRTFEGQASPELLEQVPSAPAGQVAYSYLFKDLEFTHHFEPLDHGFQFLEARVQGFGFSSHREKNEEQQRAAAQVKIHDYRSADDFIVEIATASAMDQLILAKLQPDSSLEQTAKTVLRRIVLSSGQVPEEGTQMMIPILNFRLIRDYEDLIGRTVVNSFPIVMAKQLIRFKLDETGAKLKSEAVMVKSSDRVDKPTPQLIFNKPFLILMQRKDAENPYFALWVDNAELLVPFVDESVSK